MSVTGAIAVPHPPVILPEVGRGEERKIDRTIRACHRAAALAAAEQPDVIVVASPHAELYADYFHLSPGAGAEGDFSRFGAPGVRLHADYDEEFVRELSLKAEREDFPAGTLGERSPVLDHGTMIPLYFLQKTGLSGTRIVRTGLSGLSPADHYRLGQLIGLTAKRLNRRAFFLASGDLSHKLKPDGPYGYAPQGPELDAEITKAFSTADFLTLLELSPALCEAAAECGVRSFQMMAGALDGKSVRPELLSYEGPFGVGYAVAAFSVTGDDPSRFFLNAYQAKQRSAAEIRRKKEDAYVRLARASLETYTKTGGMLPVPNDPELPKCRAGVFVSLKKHGRLRGCIGTIEGVQKSIAEEIMVNAVSAGTRDPRFPPVEPSELPELVYSVDVLTEAHPAAPEELDPAKYGVIVSCGGRRGLLLPDLEGVDTPDRQIEIALQKAGIGPDEPYRLELFEVVRHT